MLNVLQVLGIAIVGYFIFVTLWITKIEDYLNIQDTAAPGENNAE
jgi:exosortase/archaeosortase